MKLQRFFARAFLVCVALVLVAAALEIGARWAQRPAALQPVNQVNEDVHYPRPYVMFSGTPLVRDHNLLGYRGELPPLRHAPGEYRVAVIGGSTVYGNMGYAPQRSELPRLLGEEFARAGLGMVKVYNYGVASSVFRQDFMRLVNDVTPYQPDLVVFYNGGNDMMPAVDKRINYSHRFAFYQLNPALSLDPTWDDFVHTLMLNSRFLRLAFAQPIARWYQGRIAAELDHFRVAPTPEMRIEAYLDNVARARNYCGAIGCRMVAVLQPMVALKHPLAKSEELLAAAPAEDYERIPDAARRRGIEIVDFSRVFEGVAEPIFWDNIHVVPKGDAMVAHKLFEVLAPLVRGDLSHPSPKPLAVHPETYFMTGSDSP